MNQDYDRAIDALRQVVIWAEDFSHSSFPKGRQFYLLPKNIWEEAAKALESIEEPACA